MKRTFDVIASLLLLLVLSPVFLVAAVAIVLDSGRPVFFRQERIGWRAREFRVWKFRTMVLGAQSMGAGLEIEPGDTRITSVGDFLRRSSIDELPQLFNVVSGDMSIVGPRPTVRSQVDGYDDFKRRRLEVRPGITGWAQVNGRNALSWDERIKLDVWYVDHRSPWLDAVILWRTVGVLLSGEGIYAETGKTKDPGS